MKTILQILGLVFASLTGFAQWSTDPTQGNLILQVTNTLREFNLHTDNNGGTFLVWEDWRTFGPNIYAQRITTAGLPKWDEKEGHIVRAMQGYDEMIAYIAEIGSTSDGNGNAIIAWSDTRDGFHVYVQKINGTGQTQWQNKGLNICTDCSYAEKVRIISDGTGGAIIAWSGDKAFPEASEVYIQRINANGESLWQNNGVRVTNNTEENAKNFLNIVSDGNSGAIVTWEHLENGVSEIRAQKLDNNGNPQWAAEGVAMGKLTTGISRQPESIADGNGGIITVWYDIRNALGDLYAQRIASDGQLQWTLGGMPVCTAYDEQINPSIISDTQGGAIIAWQDSRNIDSNIDIYAQKINATGQAQWAVDGIPVCAHLASQFGPQMTPDGEGGAVMSWADARTSSVFIYDRDVYAQRINSSGALLWESDGVPVALGERVQGSVSITRDDNGGFVIVWLSEGSIFASRLNQDGSLPVTLISFNVHKENDSAVLTWVTSQETDNKGFEIERSADGKHFDKIAFVNPYSSESDTTQNYQYTDPAPLSGPNYYRLKQLDHDGKFAYSKMVHLDFKNGSKFFVFPNPASKAIYVETPYENGNIQVTDLIGREMFNTPSTGIRTYVDIANLPAGMYVIKTISWNQIFVKH